MQSKLPLIVIVSAVLVLAACGGEEPRDESLTGNLADLAQPEPQEPDAVEEAPQQTVVLHADPHVVVSLVTLEPGAELPDHRGEDRMAYATIGGPLTTTRGETTSVVALEEGEVVEFDDGPVTFANTGDEPIAMVLVSRSDVDLPELPPGVPPFDRERIDDHDEVLHASETALAFRTELGPDEPLPLPGAALWIVYADTGADLEMRGDDLDPVPVLLDVGDVYVSTDSMTELDNTDPTPVSLVVFVYPSSTEQGIG